MESGLCFLFEKLRSKFCFDFEIKKISLPDAEKSPSGKEFIAEVYNEIPVVNLSWDGLSSAKTYIR